MRCGKGEKNTFRKTNEYQEQHSLQLKDKVKRKGIEYDQEGFQKVFHRDRKARRNVFGNAKTLKNMRGAESKK